MHFFFLILILIGCEPKNSTDQIYPTAFKGIIDFTNWDFEKTGMYYWMASGNSIGMSY